MSKNPVSKSKPVKRNEPMHNALKFFLAGCVAEIYLLVIRRFYVNGTANELLACDAALPYLMAAGAAVAVIGLVLGIVWRQQTKRRWIGWSVFAAGVFLGGSAWMIRTFYDSALTFLCVVVPVVMLLGILWNLYDRECSWSLTILGASLIALWVCRRGLDSIFLCPDRCGSLYRGTDRSGFPHQQGGQEWRQAGQSSGVDCRRGSHAHLCGLRPVRRGAGHRSVQQHHRLLRHVGPGHSGLCSGGVLHGQAALIDPQPPFGHSEGGLSRPDKGPPFPPPCSAVCPARQAAFRGKKPLCRPKRLNTHGGRSVWYFL